MKRRAIVWSLPLALLAVALCLCLAPAEATPPPPPPPPAEEAEFLVKLHDVGVSSGANILTSSFTTKQDSGALRITAAVDGSDSTLIIYAEATDGTGTPFSLTLNSGTALTAAGNLAYTFTLGCHSDFSYNVRVGTNTRIAYLIIDEARVGAP